MNLLKKGPRAFCSWCTKALFREAVIKELPIHIMVRNPGGLHLFKQTSIQLYHVIHVKLRRKYICNVKEEQIHKMTTIFPQVLTIFSEKLIVIL